MARVDGRTERGHARRVGTRRTFLAGGLAAAALGGGTWAWLRARGYAIEPPLDVGGAEGRPKVAALPGAPYPPRALETLPPLVDVLLPGEPDLSLPSGSDAGVVDFLVSASRSPGLTPLRNDVLKLTRWLDRAAQSEAGVRFVDLSDPTTRAAVVGRAAQHTSAIGRFVPAVALEATLRLCLEGYLGHPHHGGNRGAAVWDALSIPMPRERTPAHHHHG